MHKKAATIFTIAFILVTILVPSQNNLVPNGSFETNTDCPWNAAQVNFAPGWYSPTAASSDYYDTCSTGLWDVPDNWHGYQIPHNGGGAYMGIITQEQVVGNPSWLYREYIQAQLTTSLTAGKVYFISFYVSLADSVMLATDCIGAHLSVNSITLAGFSNSASYNFTVTPQVVSTPGQILANSTSWYQISGAYVAFGGENYITIGNFLDNQTITTIRRFPSRPVKIIEQAYYYIDNVCVSQDASTCGVDPILASVSEHSPKKSSIIYDNQQRKITLDGNSLQTRVSVASLYGNIIRSFTLSTGDEFPVSDLPCGMYLVFLTDSRETSCKKIIIY